MKDDLDGKKKDKICWIKIKNLQLLIDDGSNAKKEKGTKKYVAKRNRNPNKIEDFQSSVSWEEGGVNLTIFNSFIFQEELI